MASPCGGTATLPLTICLKEGGEGDGRQNKFGVGALFRWPFLVTTGQQIFKTEGGRNGSDESPGAAIPVLLSVANDDMPSDVHANLHIARAAQSRLTHGAWEVALEAGAGWRCRQC